MQVEKDRVHDTKLINKREKIVTLFNGDFGEVGGGLFAAFFTGELDANAVSTDLPVQVAVGHFKVHQ